MELNTWRINAFINDLDMDSSRVSSSASQSLFSGNPAVVCFSQILPSDARMQILASEFNAPASVFISANHEIRWFSPVHQLSLCGHGTLAAARFLFDTFPSLKSESNIELFYPNGTITATHLEEDIEICFDNKAVHRDQDTEFWATLLGDRPDTIFLTPNKDGHCIACFESEDQVVNLKPDFDAICAKTRRAIIVTARANAKPYDIVQRVFTPQYGAKEDSVTGSAAILVAEVWNQLRGEERWVLLQQSCRTGLIQIKKEEKLIKLCGKTNITFRGNVYV